jgi:mannosyltransferase OCH1-like enzyme
MNSDNQPFPKIIHQIWYQGVDQIPSKLQKNSMDIINFHPGWQYMIWDNTKIENFFQLPILKIYRRLKYLHQKVDFIRYCILYEFGGAYLDMDITILKPLDDIMEQYKDYEAILSTINISSVESYILTLHKEFLNNGVIISKPKSGFMLSLIDYISHNYNCGLLDINRSLCINWTTGPAVFTKLYNIYPEKNRIKVLHWSFFEPCIVKGLCDIRENTILVHHHDNTWVHTFFTSFGYYYLKYKLVFAVVLFITIVYLIYQ